MSNAYISGTGFYVPPRVVKNEDLKTQYGIDTAADWRERWIPNDQDFFTRFRPDLAADFLIPTR